MKTIGRIVSPGKSLRAIVAPEETYHHLPGTKFSSPHWRSAAKIATPMESTDERSAASWVYPSLFAIIVARLWILPLRDGFWADETGSVWAVQSGLHNIIARCTLWPAQSPAYSFILWLMYEIKGPNEILLRLPSLVAMALAAFMLYRLAARLLAPQAAWPSVIVFSSLAPVAFAAGDARPYAIATMSVIGATLFLVRWLDTKRSLDAFLYCVFAALGVYMHFLFITPLLVQLIYALYRVHTEKRISVARLTVATLATIVLLLPFAFHFLSVMRTAQSHSFSGTPTPADLFAFLTPPVIAGTLLGFLFLLLLLKRPFSFALAHPDDATLILLAAWALIPVALLYGASVLTSVKVFLPRYALPSEAALALFAGWILGAISPAKIRSIAIAAVALMVLISAPSAHYAHGGDWRAALASARATAGSSGMPVLIRSDFPEAEPFNWLNDPARKSYLFAPLAVYPVAGNVIPLPSHPNAASASYLDQLMPSLERSQRFLLVNMGDPSYQNWLLGRFCPRALPSATSAPSAAA